MSAECVKVVDESGEVGDACLPVSPDAQRVDLAKPTFGNPTSITNPLHPTSQVQQTIYGGHVDGKPFRTEVSLLPGVKPTVWQGKSVNTAIIQYVAYLDGRIHEVAIDWYAQADDGSVWYFGEDVFNYEDGKVADTKGTWAAGDTTPAAMIMPAESAGRERLPPRECAGDRIRGGARRKGRPGRRRAQWKHPRRDRSQRAAHGRHPRGKGIRARLRRVLDGWSWRRSRGRVTGVAHRPPPRCGPR